MTLFSFEPTRERKNSILRLTRQFLLDMFCVIFKHVPAASVLLTEQNNAKLQTLLIALSKKKKKNTTIVLSPEM